MNLETVKISDLSPDPGNIRRHSARNIEAVKASLRRFGQQVPLVADAANVVRVGNARLEAMKQLGWETAQVVRSNLAGTELVAYGIADNRSGDPDVGSTFDTGALGEVLAALAAEDADLATAAGYSPAEIAALVGTDKIETPEGPEEFPEYAEDIDVQHECPKCKFRWSGSSAPAKGAS